MSARVSGREVSVAGFLVTIAALIVLLIGAFVTGFLLDTDPDPVPQSSHYAREIVQVLP